MTIAPLPSRYRRALGWGGASILLHLLALWWLLPQLNAAPVEGEAIIETRLIAVAPVPKPEPEPRPPPPKKTPARKRPAPAPAALPDPAPAVPAEAVEPGAAEKLSDVQFVQPATVEATPAPPPVPALPEPAPPAARQYRVDLPPSSRIVLGVERTDADGTRWHGEQAISWKLDGGRYRMKVEAGIRVLVRVNLLVLESEGKVGAAGFVPETLTEKRRGRAQTVTHFNENDGRITFSASAASVDLLPGAQDKATVPLQLAAIARGDSSQLDGGIDILVGEDKDASVFHFVVLGHEEIDTGLGRMRALHLSRPPRAGAYGSRLDIWLAPGVGWLPVRISNIEASGAVTTQTVNTIETMDAGS